MRAQGWLCFNGIELVNDVRTMTYLRRGLVPQWQVPVLSVVPEGSGYSDSYIDEYLGDPFDPHNLPGYCEAIDFSTDQPLGGYLSPSADDAPWFIASRPESADFVGLLLEELQIPSAMSRAVNAAGPVGASFGRLFPKQRTIAISALMYASSDCGMAYGERWLSDVLSGNLCDPLTDLGDMEILPCCPATPTTGGYTDTYHDIYIGDALDPGVYFRTLKRAGLVDGPIFSELGNKGSIPECIAQRVDFQISSELPWLYAPSKMLANAIPVGPGGAVSGLVSTDDWVGDAAAKITIAPTTDFTATIEATPLTADEACRTAGASPAISYTVTIPAGNTWIWDSAARTILEFLLTSKAWSGGVGRLTIPDAFDWIEAPPCSRVCVSILGISGTANVTIEQFNREL